MVVNRKKLRNRIFKFSFSFVIAALALVLGFSVRSNAKASIFTPSSVYTNDSLFTYSNNDYIFTINSISYSRTSSGSVGDKYLFNQLDFNSLLSVSLTTSSNHITNANVNGDFLLSHFNICSTKGNGSFSYFGSYFSSKFFYLNNTNDISSSNSSLFNHFRLYAYIDYDSAYVNFFDSNIDTHLYVLPLINDDALYTSRNIPYYTYIYPDIDYDTNLWTIDTNINMFDYYEEDGTGDLVASFNSVLMEGIVLDFYFYEPLKYSQYNNFIGFASRCVFADYDEPIHFYINSYLDYVPISTTMDSYQAGYNDGVSSVNTNQYYDNGYNSGYSAGQNSVDVNAIAQNNYQAGYNAGLLNSSHDYGIKDLIYSIFDVPINVLSNLFSFTIFGSNVWAIIVSLLTILVVIWIVSKVLGIVFGGGGKK